MICCGYMPASVWRQRSPARLSGRFGVLRASWYLALARASEQALTPQQSASRADLDRRRAVVDFVEAETSNLDSSR